MGRLCTFRAGVATSNLFLQEELTIVQERIFKDYFHQRAFLLRRFHIVTQLYWRVLTYLSALHIQVVYHCIESFVRNAHNLLFCLLGLKRTKPTPCVLKLLVAAQTILIENCGSDLVLFEQAQSRSHKKMV